MGNGWDISGWRTGHLRHHSYYRGSGWLSIKLPMLVDSQWLKTVTELILIIKWSHTSQFYQANDISKYSIQANIMQYNLSIELGANSFWHFRPKYSQYQYYHWLIRNMIISSSSCRVVWTQLLVFDVNLSLLYESKCTTCWLDNRWLRSFMMTCSTG